MDSANHIKQLFDALVFLTQNFLAGIPMDEILMTTGSTRLRWSKEKKPKVQEAPLSKEMQMLEFAFKLGRQTSGPLSESQSGSSSQCGPPQPHVPVLAIEDIKPTEATEDSSTVDISKRSHE